jgi:5-methylthioadenosine/S-adenosylhomocysteine deaminase
MILIKNALVVTQNEKRRVIKNGAVLVDKDKIADVGATEKLEKKYARAKKTLIDGTNQVILPGLINAHTHAAMALLRGFADDLPLRQWLNEKIWPKEAKLKPKDIYQGTKLATEEMLANGTTTFFDMYWHPLAAFQAIEESGVRGFVGPLIIDLGAAKIGVAQLSHWFKKLKPRLNDKNRLAVAPHSIYTVSQETLKQCKKFADENKLLLHIHLSETEQEVADCLKKHGCRPVEYLDKIGFLGPNVVAAHVCWADDKEIKILAKNKVSVVNCPTSNLKLVSGVLPLSKMLKAGVNVCLGSDGPASNNNLDLFEEMKIAALIHKWNEKDHTAADAQTILDTATINGAKALGLEKELGSIEIGKKADLIMLDFSQPHLRPCFNPVSHLVYAAQGGDVTKTIVGGKIKFDKKG